MHESVDIQPGPADASLAIVELPLASIAVTGFERPLRDLDSLVQSIELVGFLNPITVTRDHRLVSGRHRLEAFRRLGRATIPARILDLEDLELELATIDENLVRSELTVLERAEHLKRRRQLYETLHPAARRPEGGRPPKNGETVSPFSEDAAMRLGRTQRSIQHDLQIATSIPEEIRSRLRDTPLADKKCDLLELSRLDGEAQERVVGLVLGGKVRSVRDARDVVGSGGGAADEAGAGSALVFSVLLVDPWRRRSDEPRTRRSRREIKRLRIAGRSVGEHAAADAVLLLWSRFDTLLDALAVMKSWGFTYRGRLFTWDRGEPEEGIYSDDGDEVLLLGERGKGVPPESRFPSMVREFVSAPGRRPEEVYQRIDAMWPSLQKLELFGEREAPSDLWRCIAEEEDVG